MSRDVTILFGGPGTGKTTYLIKVVEQALKHGVDPSRIAYMSFSKKAARQAVERALDPNGPLAEYRFSQEHFPWFRTLHSAAYRMLELGRHDVMTNAHFKELGSAIGMVFHGHYDIFTDHTAIDLTSLGDRCLSIYARAKARCWSLEEEWRYANEWDLPWSTVRRFAAHLDAYKQERGVIDFTDMIDMSKEALDVDLMIVDEAQDLSVQQWQAARRFGANAKQIYLAGDDDQAIYSFSGSTVTPLLTLKAKRIVLPLSRRLPRNIKAVADKVSANIKIREPKQFSARDADGLDTWVREPDDVDLSHGTWLLLCRNRSQIAKLETLARRQNVVYHARGQWSNQEDTVKAVVAYERIRHDKTITATEAKLIQGYIRRMSVPEGEDMFTAWGQLGWPFGDTRPNWMEALALPGEDREYIRGLRRRGESLRDPGRVVISTVHGAKGGEADNVLLLTDVSGRVARGMLSSPDDEWRVVYVGVSRAKERLYLAQPSTRNFWSIAA